MLKKGVSKMFAGIGLAVIGILGVVLIAILMAIPTMYLWDWLMPKLFGLPEITLGQAWGIMVLSGILFKGTSTTINK